jgi:hypothetical protein
MIDWKPLMTESEAAAYTKNSHYAGQNFYHGTNRLAADGIVTIGILLAADRVNSYGEGFYFAFNRSNAVKYAVTNVNSTIVTARVDIKNPKKFKDSIEFDDFLDYHQIPFDDFQSKVVTKILIEEGYDAIEIGGDWILVIITDRTQVAVFAVEEL